MRDSTRSQPRDGSASRAPKQERAVATRKQLIQAARATFAKDGFEHARIEDIAEKAGKTRGAFYSNFRDKEDVFFAIFEEDLNRYQQDINPELSAASTTEQRIDALTHRFAQLVGDGQNRLLYLEFKLYAIRHPRKRRRLSDLHAAMCLRCCMTEIDQLVPELRQAAAAEKRRIAAEFAASLDGLSLNRLFDPESLSDEQIRQCLRLSVTETMQRQPRPHATPDPPRKPARSAPQAPARSSPAKSSRSTLLP